VFGRGGATQTIMHSIAAALLVSLFLVQYADRPSRVEYAKSECAYCRMITDKREFGGEFELKSGKVLTFDSIECLAASYFRNWNAPSTDIRLIWVVNYSHPGTVMVSSQATFLRTGSVESPMGANIIALPSRSAAMKLKKGAKDTIMSWEEVMEFVREFWRLPPPKKGP
jgi:copper chaperone NosL